MTLITAIMLAILATLSITEVPNPRHQNRWVSDMADVIPEDAEARIEARLSALHADTDVEMAVVTVHDVSGTPKSFATQLFNYWGVGDRTTNNGILVLLVLGQRRLEIEVGTGLEARLPTEWSVAMQTRQMVPYFRQGNFGLGLETGVMQLDHRLRSPDAASMISDFVPSYDYAPAYDNIPPPSASYAMTSASVTSDRDGRMPGWAMVGLILLAPILPFWGIYRFFLIRYHRRCRTCKIHRDELSEIDDDAHLSPGQLKEESLRSVNYRVFVCRQCSSTSTLADRAWFSRYSRCSGCRFRTMTSSSQTIRSATYTSTGQTQVTEDCEWCSYHSVSYRTIPMKTRPSSSSSSGYRSSSSGSSFGGGRSSGGGGGSSW